MLWWRRLLPLGLAAILLCLADRLAYPEAASQWACTDSEPTCKSVSIVHNSWHAAIVLRKSDLAERTMPELADFPAAQFIEFSWGDKDYFPDPQSGIFGAIKAAMWSSGSVIHLVGFTDTVENFYRGATITELRLSRDRLRTHGRLCRRNFPTPTIIWPCARSSGIVRLQPLLSGKPQF